MRFIYLFSFVVLLCIKNYAQYPFYFQITSEEGLPSNEVYSIIQDKKGFIWIGCDAGIYKYDGIRFIPYKSDKQQSKSLSGLCESESGRIYCYSFKGQVFYIENDSLFELTHSFEKISCIISDNQGNIWFNHPFGISQFIEKENKWINYSSKNWTNKIDVENFTFNSKLNKDGSFSFISSTGLVKYRHGKFELSEFNYEKHGLTAGNFLNIETEKQSWLFSFKGGIVYKNADGTFKKHESKKLTAALSNRKITNLIYLQNKIWITTYSGLLIYNPENDVTEIYYPDLAISNCIIDREKNIWLTTLQNGILRIPDFEFLVWNKENSGLQHDKLYKITHFGDSIFFATVDGYVGILNTKTQEIKTYESEIKGDIQQLYFDNNTKTLYFTINNNLFFIENEKVKSVNNLFYPLKAMLHVNNEYFLCSSFGTHLYSSLNNTKHPILLTNEWSRNIHYNQKYQTLWIGTNNGLLAFNKLNNTWTQTATFLKKTQIISFYFSENEEQLFAITFKGEIYRVEKNTISKIAELPLNVQANQIRCVNNELICATNRGLWIYHLKNKTWRNISKADGLATDNIQQLCIVKKSIWLASGNGLQKIPLQNGNISVKGKLYIKNFLVNGKAIDILKPIKLNYNQSLSIQPQASAYKSNGQFKYAYRINLLDSSWSIFPGNTEQIDILKLPSGEITIELKLIDHKGVDSENSIVLSVSVNPPFWQKWWFYVLIALVVLSASYFIFRKRITLMQARQVKEIERINLENELRLTQQSALKAQMNPHFIFNVLNSIKGFIYENDKKNAASYLSNFADLIRKILELSNSPYVKLEQELEALELYIKLEAMLLHKDFSYSIQVDKNIDSSAIQIPALIIQPYVENAFKHGLRHKEGNKELNILLSKPNHNLLQIEIEDNGIGREAAEKINTANTKKHESFASTAIEKRINLLNHEKEGIIGVEFIDLKQENNLPAGTKVVLRITLS
jgi:ligand-binding sensor domain-containing protein